jgi:transposase
VRPIHHRLADRVRTHIFLCMLAYYIEWHLREVWRELLFADEDRAAKQTRDPGAPATRSDAVAIAPAARAKESAQAHSGSWSR